MQKGGAKRGRPGTIHHVSDVRWTQGWTWGGGGVVVSADPEGCSSCSRLGSNAPRLVGTRRRSTQLLGRFLNLFVLYQWKPKNRKYGVGLGTRLLIHHRIPVLWNRTTMAETGTISTFENAHSVYVPTLELIS